MMASVLDRNEDLRGFTLRLYKAAALNAFYLIEHQSASAFPIAMIRSLSLLGVVLGAISHAKAQNSSELQLPAVLTADYIEALGNNSLFLRWRPSYHFISPAGWMNVRKDISQLCRR